MKYSAALAVFGASVLVASQDMSGLANLSKCVTNCVGDKFTKTGCPNQTDIKCICSAEVFIDGITECVVENCPREEQEAALDFAKNFCAAVGVTVTKTLPAESGSTPAPTESEEPEAEETTDKPSNTTDTPKTNATTPGTPDETKEPDSGSNTLMVSGLSLVGAAFAAVFML